MPNEYEKVSSHESWGSAGAVGVVLSVKTGCDRELTETERSLANRLTSDLHDLVVRTNLRTDPKNVEAAKKERAELLSLFEPYQPIYVEEKPNEYSSDGNPWFVVTTRVGRIKIGWRKRVIELDWSDTRVEETAAQLFPNEDVTKVGRSIHCWTFGLAVAYLTILHLPRP